ncbi:MAG: hypothetical protein ACI9R8_002160, partial [Candidatus Paceibacteria bacterium]
KSTLIANVKHNALSVAHRDRHQRGLPALVFKVIHLFLQHGYNTGGFFAAIKNNSGGSLCHVCLRLGAEYLSYGFDTNSVRRERHKWVVKRRISPSFVQSICLSEWFG